MRKKRLLYDSQIDSVWKRRTNLYTRPVFYEWRELTDFLSDVNARSLVLEVELGPDYLSGTKVWLSSIVEAFEYFGNRNIIVYVDQVGEFRIDYENENAFFAHGVLSIADERFPGDVTPLGQLVEDQLKYVY